MLVSRRMAVLILANISVAPAALAQSSATAATAQSKTAVQATDGSMQTPALTSDRGLEDIVVTAQRRSERLQDVPVSITALSGAQLASSGVASTIDLTNVTPGLVWARSTAFSQPTIRGVGSRNASIGDEPNVAVYIDGVYQPEQFATAFELANIERVEVLKGPQGTLFGRNATGGAINIITKTPASILEGEINATYGSFDYKKLSGYISGPLIGDNVFVSLAGIRVEDDGYIRNIFLNRDQGSRESTSFRGKFLFKISPDVEATVTGTVSDGNDNVNLSHHPFNGNSRIRITANPNNIPAAILLPTGDYQTSTQFVTYAKTKQRSVDARVNADLGGANLLVLGAYQRNRAHVLSDSDSSPLSLAYNEDFKFTHSYFFETILSSDSSGSRLKWVIGANGFSSNAFQLPNNSNGAMTNTGQKTRSASGFGEATYEALNALFITAGLRYTYDQKESFNQPVVSQVITSAKIDSTNLSPRVVARYQITDQTNIYSSFSKGFKSATYNPLTLAGARTPARPEKVDAYEIGIKSDPLRNVRINLASYYYRYRDLQVSVNNLVGTGLVTALENAPKATIYGLEANADLRPLPGLTLRIGGSYLHTKIDEFPNASISVPTIVAGLPSGNTNIALNVAGKDLIRAPRYTANIGLTYTTPLGGGELVVSGNAVFSDRFFVEASNRLAQPKYEVVNASITWTAPGDHFSLSVFGQNLTNDRVISQLFTSALNDVVAYQKPRWFGVTAGYRF